MSAPPAICVLAPLAGVVRDLAEVPDEVFAQGMVGPGLAIEPQGSGEIDVVAPVTGTLAKVHPHAVAMQISAASSSRAGGQGPAQAPSAGRGVLVHLGIDTVRLEGRGFTVHVRQGQQVRAGQQLITWAPQVTIEAGYAALTPVLALGADPAELTFAALPGQQVAAGEELFGWV